MYVREPRFFEIKPTLCDIIWNCFYPLCNLLYKPPSLLINATLLKCVLKYCDANSNLPTDYPVTPMGDCSCYQQVVSRFGVPSTFLESTAWIYQDMITHHTPSLYRYQVSSFECIDNMIVLISVIRNRMRKITEVISEVAEKHIGFPTIHNTST